MSRIEDLEKQECEKRWAQTLKLQKWAAELQALSQHLWDEDQENGWHVRYGHIDRVPEPPLTVLVTIDGAEFARFVRDEMGIIGVFEDGGPQRFSNHLDAFDAVVKRRFARQKLRRAP
jgi:hypothetical protein